MLARFCLVAAVVLPGCRPVVGSGNVVTTERTLAPFTRVSSSGSIAVVVTDAAPGPASLKGDDNIVPLVETEVVDDTLTVHSTKSYVSTNPIVLTVGAPDLVSASVSGSGSITVRNAQADAFSVAISGSGNVHATGQATSLQAGLSGSGQLEAFGLSADKASVNVSGSGSAEVTVRKSLAANVSGSGSIRYAGDPEDVAQDVSGSGSVEPR